VKKAASKHQAASLWFHAATPEQSFVINFKVKV